MNMELYHQPQVFREQLLCMQICCDLRSSALWKPGFHQLICLQSSQTEMPLRGNTLEKSVVSFITSYIDVKRASLPRVRSLEIALMALKSHLRTLWYYFPLFLGHSSGHIFSYHSWNGTEKSDLKPLTPTSLSMSPDPPWHFSSYLTLQHCLSSSFHSRLLSQENMTSAQVLWSLELHCQFRQKTQQMFLLDAV